MSIPPFQGQVETKYVFGFYCSTNVIFQFDYLGIIIPSNLQVLFLLIELAGLEIKNKEWRYDVGQNILNILIQKERNKFIVDRRQHVDFSHKLVSSFRVRQKFQGGI